MVGRIETYIHSDKSVPNKGAAMIMVGCKTDFAARTDEFISFSKEAAKMAFASGSDVWEEVIATFPNIEARRLEVSKDIKEPITVDRIVIMTV